VVTRSEVGRDLTHISKGGHRGEKIHKKILECAGILVGRSGKVKKT